LKLFSQIILEKLTSEQQKINHQPSFEYNPDLFHGLILKPIEIKISQIEEYC